MEGDSYQQKVDYQSGNSADELKLDIPFSWFDNSDRPRTLVLDVSDRPEPPQFNRGSSPFKISAQRYAFLDLIAYAEGTDRVINGQRDGYNIMFSFETFTDFSDHPRRIINANGYSSSAAGRYQFLTQTWDECKEALNLSDFRDSSQDTAALYLIQRRGAMDYVDRGDLRGACEILSWEWASLPYNDRGDGRYGQPTVKFRDLEKVYEQTLKYYVPGNITTATEVNLNVPYLSQRDNQRYPDKTCNVTCVAMVLKYFNIPSNTSISQLEDELDRYVENRGWSRYQHSDLVKLQEAYGLKSRFTTIILGLVVDLQSAIVLSGEITIPQPDPAGNYTTAQSLNWETWQVVDPDSSGLNCRVSQDFERMWRKHLLYEGVPSDMNISRWQVKRVFSPGTVLFADLAPAGNAIITDNYGQPWIKIRIDSEDELSICLIRAHKEYIKPVNTSFGSGAVY